MLGVFLTVIGSIFEEIGTSAGKTAVKLKIESVFCSGFITNLVSTVLFVVLTLWQLPQMALPSWPTFLVRLPLELLVSYFTVYAVVKCARSAFGFIRTGTIPLLLIVDALMGYRLDTMQVLGIALITGALFYLHLNHGLEKRGLKFAVLSTILPVATTSIAKYNFNHGNSWQLEQALLFAAITVFFYVAAKSKKEKPFRHLKNPLVLIQAGAIAVGNAILVLGFNIMTPSVHSAAKRSTAVLAAVGSGGVVFHEKRMLIKALAVAACAIGVMLLVL